MGGRFFFRPLTSSWVLPNVRYALLNVLLVFSLCEHTNIFEKYLSIYAKWKEIGLQLEQINNTYLIWGVFSSISCALSRQFLNNDAVFTSSLFLLFSLYSILKIIDFPVDESLEFIYKIEIFEIPDLLQMKKSIQIEDEVLYKILALYVLFSFAIVVVYIWK